MNSQHPKDTDTHKIVDTDLAAKTPSAPVSTGVLAQFGPPFDSPIPPVPLVNENSTMQNIAQVDLSIQHMAGAHFGSEKIPLHFIDLLTKPENLKNAADPNRLLHFASNLLHLSPRQNVGPIALTPYKDQYSNSLSEKYLWQKLTRHPRAAFSRMALRWASQLANPKRRTPYGSSSHKDEEVAHRAAVELASMPHMQNKWKQIVELMHFGNSTGIPKNAQYMARIIGAFATQKNTQAVLALTERTVPRVAAPEATSKEQVDKNSPEARAEHSFWLNAPHHNPKYVFAHFLRAQNLPSALSNLPTTHPLAGSISQLKDSIFCDQHSQYSDAIGNSLAYFWPDTQMAVNLAKRGYPIGSATYAFAATHMDEAQWKPFFEAINTHWAFARHFKDNWWSDDKSNPALHAVFYASLENKPLYLDRILARDPYSRSELLHGKKNFSIKGYCPLAISILMGSELTTEWLLRHSELKDRMSSVQVEVLAPQSVGHSIALARDVLNREGADFLPFAFPSTVLKPSAQSKIVDLSGLVLMHKDAFTSSESLQRSSISMTLSQLAILTGHAPTVRVLAQSSPSCYAAMKELVEDPQVRIFSDDVRTELLSAITTKKIAKSNRAKAPKP